MCHTAHPLYRCGCPAPTQWIFYCANNTPVNPPTTNRLASNANPHPNNPADGSKLPFCCSTPCCEAAIEGKETPYYSICDEMNEALMRYMMTLSEEEVLREEETLSGIGRRGRREEAQDELEEEKARHWDCEEDRGRYLVDLEAEEGRTDKGWVARCAGAFRMGPIRRGTM